MKVIIILILSCLLASPWLINVWKLSDCDFVSDYKCEFVHGVGLVVPPSAIITVWFDDDSSR